MELYKEECKDILEEINELEEEIDNSEERIRELKSILDNIHREILEDKEKKDVVKITTFNQNNKTHILMVEKTIDITKEA